MWLYCVRPSTKIFATDKEIWDFFFFKHDRSMISKMDLATTSQLYQQNLNRASCFQRIA